MLSIGKHVDPADLGDVPANVEVHSWVPQPAILRQADLFVTHAGAGGSQEGLATATPMIAVPQAADQFGNAEVLQGLGVAKCVPTEEATAGTLRETALALLGDPEAARRLKDLQAGGRRIPRGRPHRGRTARSSGPEAVPRRAVAPRRARLTN